MVAHEHVRTNLTVPQASPAGCPPSTHPAHGGAERGRGAGDLHAQRAPPLGQRDVAVVGARHPRPPARHRAAGRRDSPPWPTACVRTRPRAVGGAEPWPQVHPGVVRGNAGRTRRRTCERRAAAAGWQVPAEPTIRPIRLNLIGCPVEVPPLAPPRTADARSGWPPPTRLSPIRSWPRSMARRRRCAPLPAARG